MVAHLMAEQRPALARALHAIVEARFDRLRRVGSCDALSEIVLPCVDDVMGALTGLPMKVRGDALISRVFSQTMGVARRKRLNAEIEDWRSQIAEAFPEEDAMRREARLSILVLGRDALIGTVALSLRAHFEQVEGNPLSSAAMPTVPTHTGVPFVDREAQADLDLGGCPIHAGETVRVALDGFQGMPDASRLRFFGAGRHLCLGRPLSLELMERISATLATVRTRVAVADFRLRKDDVFAFPETFRIEIRE